MLNFIAFHLLADGAADGGEVFCDLDWSLLVSALLTLPALCRFVLYVRCNRPRPAMVGRYLHDLMPLRRAGKFILYHAKVLSCPLRTNTYKGVVADVLVFLGGRVRVGDSLIHPEERDRGMLEGR